MRPAISLIVSAVGILVVQSQVPDSTHFVVNKTFENDGRTITGLGACNVTADSVSCWDMDGVPNAILTDRVKAQLLARNGNETGFVFQKKNRVLLIRSDKFDNISYSIGDLHSYSNSFDGDQHTQMIRIAAEPDINTVGITARIYNFLTPEPKTIRFGEGAITGFEGQTITLGKPSKYSAPVETPGMSPLAGPQWAVPVSIKSTGTPLNGIQMSVFDKDSSQIYYVDKSGNPVSSLVVASESPTPDQFGNRLPRTSGKYRPVTFNSNGRTVGDVTVYVTNVNPDKIASLKLSMTIPAEVVINGFPLDPK